MILRASGRINYFHFIFEHPVLLFKAYKCNKQPSRALTLAGSQAPKKPFQLGMSGNPVAEWQCRHHSSRIDLSQHCHCMVPSSSITFYLVRQQEFIHCHSKRDKLNTITEENGSGLAQRSPVIPFFGGHRKSKRGRMRQRLNHLSLPSSITEGRAALPKSSISVWNSRPGIPQHTFCASHPQLPEQDYVQTGPCLLKNSCSL